MLALAELLHHQYAGRQVAIVPILQRGDRFVLADMTKLGYSVPIALDPKGAVTAKLGMSSGSVLIIDPAGTVVYSGGSQYAPTEIIQQLRKAGLW